MKAILCFTSKIDGKQNSGAKSKINCRRRPGESTQSCIFLNPYQRVSHVPTAAKYPLPPKVADFAKPILRYPELCYANFTFHILKTFPILYVASKSYKLQEIDIVRAATFGGKWYFAAVSTVECMLFSSL